MGELETFTLSGRIDAIFDMLIKERRATRNKTSLFISPRRYCVVCGLLRFDQDLVGMTCGSERCLAGLEETFEELSDDSQSLKDLAKTAGIFREDGSFSLIELEGKIEDRITMEGTLKEIALKLGLDIEKDIETLCNEIKVEIENLRFIVEKLEKKQN